MVDKKVSKKDVDVKPAAPAAKAEEHTIVTISGETYKKMADGRLINTGA